MRLQDGSGYRTNKTIVNFGRVKLVECPRDAWQGLKGQIPADLKTNYL